MAQSEVASCCAATCRIGAAQRRNQELIDEMMRACRLSTPVPKSAYWSTFGASAGALGAKLTGAGGGGAIFAAGVTGR